MIFNKTRVEVSDKDSRFVLKRIKTSSWECLNRKIAITNQIRSYEEAREQFKKSVFNSNFQTHHIRWDSKMKCWDFEGLKEAKTEAQKKDRLFIAQRQMNQTLWKDLTKEQAFNEYEELINRGLKLPAINIPKKFDISKYKELIKDAESILNGTQKVIPIISSRHDFAEFPEIIKYALSELSFLGIHLYSLSESKEFLNLSALRKANSEFKKDDEAPLIFGFNHSRHLENYSYVSSSFAYSCFGIDVFSERQYFLKNMSEKAIKEMMKRTPDQFMLYDVSQGGFNRAKEQIGWHGVDLTNISLMGISVEEGLTAYQSLIWINSMRQQSDLSILNGKLMNKESIINYIEDEKPRWARFYTEIKNRI